MSEPRVTTEEAERVATEVDNCFGGGRCVPRHRAAAALRSLAAERDALREKNRLLRVGESNLAAQVVQMREALKEIDAYVHDALGEYQP